VAIELGGRRRGPRALINVTPLVDVVLVLLIIFMVVPPLLDQELGVSLPTERVAAPTMPERRDQIVLYLDRHGRTFLNDTPVARERVPALLRGVLRRNQEKVVFFRADYDTPYGDAVALMDAAKGAGARTLGTVLTEPEAAR